MGSIVLKEPLTFSLYQAILQLLRFVKTELFVLNQYSMNHLTIQEVLSTNMVLANVFLDSIVTVVTKLSVLLVLGVQNLHQITLKSVSKVSSNRLINLQLVICVQ